MFFKKKNHLVEKFFSHDPKVSEYKNKEDYQLVLIRAGDYTISTVLHNTGVIGVTWQMELKNKGVYVPLTESDCKDFAKAINRFLKNI